jgi:hypothetical protein
VRDPARATTSLWGPDSATEQAAWTRLAPYLAFLFLAVLYTATLHPSVAGGDSGELTAAALTGGVPHPPGYPLFALLARLFAALPLGHTPAWRVNLLSALSMAAAGGLACAVVQSWTRSVVAGLWVAALFGTNPMVWSYATGAEVFGLNAMFVALAFHLWSRAQRSHSRGDVLALVFASGLAMCNHHTFVFVGGPLVVHSLWATRGNLGARGMTLALTVGLLGLLPYLYLVPASASAAAVSWGDETSVVGLINHVLRRDYGTFSMGQTSTESVFVAQSTFLPTLWLMWGRAFSRLLWIGPVLALAGLYLGTKERQMRALAAFLLFILCFYCLTFCALSNLSTERPLWLGILGRFCIQSDLLLAIASGLGLTTLSRRLRGRGPWLRLVPVGVGLVCVAGVAGHVGQANARDNTVLQDFVATAFASLPPNAIAITAMGDDVAGAVHYYHEVERLRPDVVHLDSDFLSKPWYLARVQRFVRDVNLPDGVYGRRGWNLKQLLELNPNRPLVFIGQLDEWDTSWQGGYKLACVGLVRSLVRASDFPTYEAWAERDRQAMGAYDVTAALRGSDESWERALGQRVLDTQIGRAHLALLYGQERSDPVDPARTALRLLEDVVAKTGGDRELGIAAWPGTRKLDMGAGVWKNLALAYQFLSGVDGSYARRFTVACKRFVARANPSDPDLPAARKYLEGVSAPGRR